MDEPCPWALCRDGAERSVCASLPNLVQSISPVLVLLAELVFVLELPNYVPGVFGPAGATSPSPRWLFPFETGLCQLCQTLAPLPAIPGGAGWCSEAR